MFITYRIEKEIHNDKKLSSHVITLIDQDFEESFIAEQTGTGINITDPIINIYRARKMNIAANIALLLKHTVERFSIKDTDAYLTRLAKSNQNFAAIKDEVEKYFLLL